ncbi:MAG: glycine zipper 2TM domain-containing protein [Proteobacteria bacterium]|nr:glycine zipper 2TM domain-containing protein [Pseudomonadota bacterium]
MKKFILFTMIIVLPFAILSCESIGGMSDTTKGAAVGAGLGAIAGQVIGGNTAGTLIGVAGGALAGALVGHEMDYQKQKKADDAQKQKAVYASPDTTQPPPGRWMEVPGQWVNGQWVPAHKVWVPVNP